MSPNAELPPPIPKIPVDPSTNLPWAGSPEVVKSVGMRELIQRLDVFPSYPKRSGEQASPEMIALRRRRIVRNHLEFW